MHILKILIVHVDMCLFSFIFFKYPSANGSFFRDKHNLINIYIYKKLKRIFLSMLAFCFSVYGVFLFLDQKVEREKTFK